MPTVNTLSRCFGKYNSKRLECETCIYKARCQEEKKKRRRK